ncbi:MAG: hypothetical protein A2Y10_01910 [Planctomycetes bacterium GWF2_41_51]|nr:MAG: hypothetical protein A2Y10_01910 [Planctomycetes bacterium GWF2_41_51]HBG26306.1 hypothetical protein [Phycisphaerales bacterium]
MTYKAVIFDLDGTLVNSLQDLADATNFALHFYDQQVHSTEAFMKMIGDGTRTLISRALAGDKQELIEQVLVKMREKYIEICLDKSLPYKGFENVLPALKKQGIKMAVLTNKDQKMSEKVVRHFFPDMFEIVKGGNNGAPVKPEPTAALQILDKLGVKPNEAVFVGDSNVDIKTAKAANMKSIGVSWGFRGEAELREAGADFISNEPSELIKLIVNSEEY